MEIPFLDAPEGACNTTITRKAELVNAEEWKKQRPRMLMIDIESWAAIKQDWRKACRYAGEECNVTLDSVDTAIKSLDNILKTILEGKTQ